ncbi:MAG: NYN domain-containing protein [Coriobacteriales bacterium]|nr:NYN domain-containing protein [Coriobacteriales bacterium]
MLFIIDGYNVTRGDPATRDRALEEQRDALVRRLAARSAAMLGPGRVLVVFDGERGAGESRRAFGAVEVRYSREGSADDAIVQAATSTSEPIVLVSDDLELAARVRAHAAAGVHVRSRSCCFEAAGRGAARKGRRPSVTRDSGLPRGANRITEELKDIWLSDEE